MSEDKSVLATVHFAKLPVSKKEQYEGKEMYVKVSDSNSQNVTPSKGIEEMEWETVVGIMTEEDQMTVSLHEDGEDEPIGFARVHLNPIFEEPSSFKKDTLKLKNASGKTVAKVHLTLCHMPGLQVSEETLSGNAAPAEAPEEDEFSDG